MDANTLPDQSAAVPRPSDTLRRLWQAPVFVLGVGAVLCFWFCQPYLCQSHGIDKALEKAREDVERPNCDAVEIAHRLQSLIDHDLPDAFAGQAHFLYGAAEIRIAESMTGEPARDHWNRAREQLEEAEKWGVPPGDQLKLQYRLGKVGYYLRSDPDKVVERLAASLDAADDRAEGYNLLTAAYLRQTPPNLQAALDTNEQQLRSLIAPEEVLAQVRLTGGEILLRMHRTKEARELLVRINSQAPLAVLMKAHMLRAQSKQDENDWGGALTLWKAALDESPDPAPETGLIRYNLGLCYRRLDLPTAAPIWEECVRANSGDESQAAAVGLAELLVQQGQGDKARERLEFAFNNVHKPEDWDNKLLDRAAACELVERCCQTARQAGKFDLALQMVGWYERLATPARSLVMRGDIAADWARARREDARKPPVAAEETAVRGLFKQAAEAYEQAAKQTPAMPEHGEYLWKAATCFIDAAEQVNALALLDEMFELTPRPDARLGEGWYLLGESFRKEIRPDDAKRDIKRKAAEDAYSACLSYQTTFSYEARYQIAQFKIEQGKIDAAVIELEQILTQLPGEECDIKQRARFALVDVCYRAKKEDMYRRVVRRMEEVLDHLPATAEAAKARFELADSYRLLADEQDRLLNDGMTYREQASAHAKELRDGWRKRASEEFENLVSLIEKPDSAQFLDDTAQRDAYYFAAYTPFQQGQFQQALVAYMRMAKRYSDERQSDHWTAIAGMVSAYMGLENKNRILQGLETIKDGINSNVMDANTRKSMEKYVHDVEDMLKRRPMP